MKNGYEIFWTHHAQKELENTVEYLRANFSEKELKILAEKIENIVKLISESPTIFPETEYKGIRKAIVLKFNSLYYRVSKNRIEILSFFSNRQNPNKKKFAG